MDSLGSRLKRARERANKTQGEVCKLLGISIGTLSGYERNYRDPDPNMLVKLANLYGVSTDFLLGLTDDPRGSTTSSDGVSAEEKEFLRWVREHVAGVFFAEFDEAPEESKAAVMETLRWYWENIEKPRMKKNKGSNQ